MNEIKKLNNEIIFILKPHKNWLGIIFSILILLMIPIVITIYSMMIYFEKQYNIIPFLLITIGIILFIIRQLIWTFKGKTELLINKTELTIRKNIKTFCKLKSYYLDEIENVTIENLFFLKMINNIPLFGGIYLSLINKFKNDSESIVIKYRQNEIEIINNLTKENANLILNKIKEYQTK